MLPNCYRMNYTRDCPEQTSLYVDDLELSNELHA